MIIQFPAKLAKKLRTYRPVKRVGWAGYDLIIFINLTADKERTSERDNDHNRQDLKDQEKTRNSLDLILTRWC